MSDLPRALCAWCRRLLRDGPEPATHGICPTCQRGMVQELELLRALQPRERKEPGRG